MTQTIFHNDFSAGWCPSDDVINGRKNAMLQMDNMELDKNGALTLIGGTSVKSSGYPSNAHTLFSRFLNGTRYDYAALASGAIYRNGSSLATGGDSTNAAFGTAFNFALLCSGNKRLKDDASGPGVNLGLTTQANAPTIGVATIFNAPWTSIASPLASTVVITGSSSVIGGNYIQTQCDVGSGIFAIQTYVASPSAVDCTQIQGHSGDIGLATDDDFVTVNGYTNSPWGISLQLDILLVAGDAGGDIVSDYYTYTVLDIGSISGVVNYDVSSGAFSIKVARNQFQRIGNGNQDWSTTYGFRITWNVNKAEPTTTIMNLWGYAYGGSIVMQGGSNAQFGTNYQYAQMDVNNTGSYLAKSALSPITNPRTIFGNQALITPHTPTDAQANEVWIFRRGGNLGGTWYRVAKLTSLFTTQFYDTVGDQAALDLDITVNLNLVPISSASITDKIYDIVGPIQGRWFYFTTNFLYPSDINDPDLVDPSLAIRTCGSNSELFMWARAISATVVLVGTTVDVYLLTGTFSTLPDGTVDVYYQRLGVKFPPITYDAVAYGGTVYYMANDGWRTCTATSFGTTYSSSNNQLLVAPNTDRLYRGENAYGYTAPTLKITPGSARFPVCVVRNKLWCFITGTNRAEVFDFQRGYWRTFNYGLGDATAVTDTQDGQVLAFYGNDKKVREIGILSSKLIDGVTQQTINLLFLVEDGGSPRQRKDTYTFKIRSSINTGSLTLAIINDQGVQTTISGTISSSNEQFLDLSKTSAVQLTKYYQVTMTGAFNDLTIEDYSIDYDARPVPVTFLRFPSINYNTTAKKRIYTVPFQIDTLGNPVLVTPTVDLVAQTALNVTSSHKTSFDYQFPISGTDILQGTDYEWTIDGQGKEFEFYGFEEIRNIEVFPDPCVSFVIPTDNFGNPTKKRVRGWPFIINTRGQTISFTPVVDNVALPAIGLNTPVKQTVRAFYTTDVFGTDYSGFFSGPNPFEVWKILQPDIVQALPQPRQFDQVGPLELQRFGKIVQIGIRILPFLAGQPGTFPYSILFQDSSIVSGNLTVVDSVEDTYYIDVPKGTSGRVMRVTFGPTNFNFHRYYFKIRVAESGGQENTELRWITLGQDNMMGPVI